MPDQPLDTAAGDPENPNYIGTREAALILGVSEITVRSAINEGRLPFWLAYGHKVVSRAALEEYRARTQPDGQPKRGRPKSK